MLINITQKDGTTIETKDKHVSDNLTVVPVLDEVNATPSESTQTFTPGTGFAGFDKVIVAPIPSEYVKPEGTLDVTENGTQDVTNYKNINVNVEPNLEEKTVTITENGTTEVTPTSGKDGISKVTINTNVPTASAVEEVATASAMDALLVEANVGKYYKFTGTTDTNYTNGDLYLVEGGVVTEHTLTYSATNSEFTVKVNDVAVNTPYQLTNGDVITLNGESVVWDSGTPLGDQYTGWQVSVNGSAISNGGTTTESGDIDIVATRLTENYTSPHTFNATINYTA